MIRQWFILFRGRRRRSNAACRRARSDLRHRRPGLERLEDRCMLSGDAGLVLPYDGFIDAAEGLVAGAEAHASYGSLDYSVTRLDGITTDHVFSFGENIKHTIPEPQPRPEGHWAYSSTSDDPSGPKPVTILAEDDIEPLRLGPEKPSAAQREERAVDVTDVLTEPVGFAVFEPTFLQECVAGLAGAPGRTGSAVAQRDGRDRSASQDAPLGFALALSWRAGALRDFSADGPGPVALRDSPFRPIEGARGVSQAFELGTAGEESLAKAEPQGSVPPGFPFHSPQEPVRSPAGPDRASSDRPSPRRGPSPEVPLEPSDRSLASVAQRVTEAAAARQAVFAKLAEPFGEALLNAVYLENKRATDLIPLLAVAALTHHLASREWEGPINDRIGVAYPRRRHPL